MAKRNIVKAINWAAIISEAYASDDNIAGLIASALQSELAREQWGVDFAQEELMLDETDAQRFGVAELSDLTHEQLMLCGRTDFDEATNERDEFKRVNYLSKALAKRVAWLRTL